MAGAVILNLSKNNPIDSAKKAKFQSDIDTFKSELSLYELGKIANSSANYDPSLLNADKSGSTENGSQTVDATRPITEIISSMKRTKYDDVLEIEAGKLVYIGSNITESNWASSLIEVKGFSINLSVIPDSTHISGQVSLSGDIVDVTKIEYCKIYLSTESGVRTQEAAITITNMSLSETFDITEGVEEYKTYYIIVDIKMTNEAEVRTKELKVVSSVDDVKPNIAQISKPIYSRFLEIAPVAITMSDNDGGSGISKTNSKYIVDQINTNYNEEDLVWNAGINFTFEDFVLDIATIKPEVPSDGEYYIHVLSVDNSGNKISSISSKIMVDTTVPNEPLITIPTQSTTSSTQATVTMSDNTNGSGLNLSNCKYIYSTISSPYGDTEEIWNTATVFSSAIQTITVTSSTNEIYYLHVLLVDNAGNRREILSSGVTTNTDVPVAPVVTGTVATNAWTNQNVTLTVNTVTSPNIVKYEYTINGGSFQTYSSTDKIIITGEGTTIIKARAVNNVGTAGAESVGYIVNIDRTSPVVTFGTNGGQNITQVSTTVSVTDSESGVKATTLQYVWDTQNSVTPSSGWTTFTNGSALSKTGDGQYYLWIKATDNTGNTIIAKSNKFIVGELFEIVSSIRTYNVTFSGATTGYSYDNPVIPAGFRAVNTDDAKWDNLLTDWNNGLVIVDSYGNQFVWVPVDGTNVAYAKWCTTNISYANTTDDTLPTGFSVSNITTTYKGFYIARYESAFDYNSGSIRAASKKSSNKTTTNWSTTRNSTYNGYLWNYVSYTDSKSYAESMAASYGYNTSLIGTNLITGAQWDTTLKWIQNSGKTVTDSRAWGNHPNSISPANVSGYGNLQISGYSNYWKAKNIYDLAGNAWEWANEKYSSYYILRGGNYYDNGADYPASRRSYGNASDTTNIRSFRVAIFIK